MKRSVLLLLAVLLLLSGCGKAEAPEGKKWDCTVVVPTEDPTYIVYSEESLVTDSGSFSFQNRNPFPVTLYLYQGGEQLDETEMTPGGVFVRFQIKKGEPYTVGFHADQPVGTEIRIMAYDGNATQDTYQMDREAE